MQALYQRCTNFPKMQQSPQNFKRQGYMKHVPTQDPPMFRHHSENIKILSPWRTGAWDMCTPALYHKLVVHSIYVLTFFSKTGSNYTKIKKNNFQAACMTTFSNKRYFNTRNFNYLKEATFSGSAKALIKQSGWVSNRVHPHTEYKTTATTWTFHSV